MTRDTLHETIHAILREESQGLVSYNYNEELPYQSYERIAFTGRRWSVEKRVAEYRLERLFDPNARVLDIGSNFGFFVCEFALHCRSAEGIEHNKYLNRIGRATAEFLGLEAKTIFHDGPFEQFNGEDASFDRILTLAAFYTTDGMERSSAASYFGKIHRLLKPDGVLFYESTSYPLDPESVDRGHYVASREAKRVIEELFTVDESYETPSGAYHRYFMLARKG